MSDAEINDRTVDYGALDRAQVNVWVRERLNIIVREAVSLP